MNEDPIMQDLKTFILRLLLAAFLVAFMMTISRAAETASGHDLVSGGVTSASTNHGGVVHRSSFSGLPSAGE
jgi:hypothetical protein